MVDRIRQLWHQNFTGPVALSWAYISTILLSRGGPAGVSSPLATTSTSHRHVSPVSPHIRSAIDGSRDVFLSYMPSFRHTLVYALPFCKVYQSCPTPARLLRHGHLCKSSSCRWAASLAGAGISTLMPLDSDKGWSSRGRKLPR